jgi:hypothetical protein
MKITSIEINSLPVIIIDDFYDENSCNKIMLELEFLYGKLSDPENNGAAFKIVDGEKIFKKNNPSIFLDKVYLDRTISNILIENRKLFDPELLSNLINQNCFFRYLEKCNFDNTLINYYDNKHYYESHTDDNVITASTIFYKEPKSFSGGDMIIEGVKIDCEYNRCIVFPGILNHGVTMVHINKLSSITIPGRFSITQFVSFSN